MYAIVTEVKGYKIRYEGPTVEETVRLFREACPPPAKTAPVGLTPEASAALLRELDRLPKTLSLVADNAGRTSHWGEADTPHVTGGNR